MRSAGQASLLASLVAALLELRKRAVELLPIQSMTHPNLAGWGEAARLVKRRRRKLNILWAIDWLVADGCAARSAERSDGAW